MSSVDFVFTGITGLLGKYFLENKGDYNILGISNRNLPNLKNCETIDITNNDLTVNFISKINPKVIIHAASIGNVDYCESHPDEAYKVNVLGTKNIIEGALKTKAKIIFISSNAIYEGSESPYNEKSNLNPVDVYGKTKVEGEKLVKESGLDFVIIRLMTMYGWPQKGGRSNPVTWIIDRLRRKEKINMVNDIYNNHLWAGQAADAVWRVIENNIRGRVYNIAGKDCINRYDLALEVAKVFDLDVSLINEVDSSFFQGIAKRPKNTCFDISLMRRELGLSPLSINQGLELMRKEENDKAN